MLRTQALIPSNPPGNGPRTPIYFSNGFPAARAGRMTVSLPRTTNSTRSPTLKPNRVRILFGTVTCPLVLMTLESAISLPSIPTVRISIPTSQVKPFAGRAGRAFPREVIVSHRRCNGIVVGAPLVGIGVNLTLRNADSAQVGAERAQLCDSRHQPALESQGCARPAPAGPVPQSLAPSP